MMPTKSWMRRITWLTLLWTGLHAAAAAHAQDYTGTYESTQRWREGRRSYQMRFTLFLQRNRDAQIVTESLDTLPNADRDTVRDHGTIVEYLQRRRRVSHEGAWEVQRGELSLRMSTLEGDRLDGEYRGEMRGRDLVLSRMDADVYGTSRMVFTRRENGTTPGRPDTGDRFLGAYLFEKRWQTDGEDQQVRFTLNILRNRGVELVSELGGQDVLLNRDTLNRHGDILSYLQRRRRVVHTGSWETRGDRLQMHLTSLNGERVEGDYTAEFRGRDLVLTDYDERTYGTTRFVFRAMDSGRPRPPVLDPRPDPVPPRPDVPRATPEDHRVWRGSWETTLRIPGDAGRLQRLVQLFPDGNANITQQYIGGRDPNKSGEAIGALGSLFRLLSADQTIAVHFGKWDARGDTVTLRLDKVDRSSYPTVVTFRLVDGDLVPVSISQELYGKAAFRLTRRRE